MLPRSSLPALLLVALAAACSNKDKTNATADSAAAAANAATPAASAAAPGMGNVVTVTARDFAFEAPAEIQAGLTTFRMVNAGPTPHHLQIVKLQDGKTAADYVAALKAAGPTGKPPAWAADFGGPNAVVANDTSVATLMLEPGTYAFVCFVDIPDHVPHLMKGMERTIKVTAPAATQASAAEPQADVTVTLKDYDFTWSTPLTAGQHTIRVDNAGPQPHEIEMVQLAPGKTMDDLMKFAQSYQGQPPGRLVGGIAGFQANGHQYFSRNFAPGNYVVMCFVPDVKDGKPHFMHGMAKQITVS